MRENHAQMEVFRLPKTFALFTPIIEVSHYLLRKKEVVLVKPQNILNSLSQDFNRYIKEKQRNVFLADQNHR